MQKMNQNLKVLTYNIDPLTGLNDRSILPALNKNFSEREYTWSLIIIDIDHFKLVNDIYGHLVGDEVLSHVGHTLRINLKRRDFPLRYGGDEFIAILPDTNGNGALALAQRLLFELENRELPLGLKISASFGIAQSTKEDKNLTDLIAKADQALYYAKETGRGRFVLADDLEIRNGIQPDFSQMIGRREELQYLQELLDSTINDSARICLLTGYKGTGKTKLVNEFLNYCQFKKISVYKTEIQQIDEEDNYLILDIIKKILSSLTENTLESVYKAVGPVEDETIEQLPEFSFTKMNRSILPSQLDKSAKNRRNLGTILKEMSKIHPFVIILNNLHTASNTCLEFTIGVINTIMEAHILYIAKSDKTGILKFLNSIYGKIQISKLHLSPMNKTDIRTMIFFAMKSPEIPTNVIEYFTRQSGGNTLFLRKLINWSIKAGYLSTGQGDVCLWKEPAESEIPDGINHIIEMMLNNYSETELKVLKRAALAGNSFTLDLLSELTSINQFDLAEILDKFIERGLIQDFENYFSFSFGVMRSNLMSRISPSFRRLLHEKTAQFLTKQISSSEDTDSLTNTIAYHFCHSANSTEAAKYSREAAQISFNKGLHSDAIHWYQEFLKLDFEETNLNLLFRIHLNIGILYSITGEAELGEQHMIKALKLTNDPIDLCGVFYRLGDNYHRRSMYYEAIEFYEKTLSNGYSIKSKTSVLIHNMIGALLGLSFVSRIQGKFQKANQLLSQARKLLDSEKGNYKEVIEGMYYARLADIEAEIGSKDTALEYYRKGLKICIEGKDSTGEAIILNNMHSLFTINGDYNSMLDSLKQVIKINTRLNDQLGIAIGYYNLAEAYIQLNMLDLARRYFQMYIELSNRINNRLGLAYGQQGLGNLAMIKGLGHKAAEYFAESSKIFDELNCSDAKKDAYLERIKALISVEDYKTSDYILNKIQMTNTALKFQNSVSHLKGVLLYHTSNNQVVLLKKAIFLLKKSINTSEDLSLKEIVYMYTNLYNALQSNLETNESIKTLKKGHNLLNLTLSKIKSESIRNSLLSRTDITAFLQICINEGIIDELPAIPEIDNLHISRDET